MRRLKYGAVLRVLVLSCVFLVWVQLLMLSGGTGAGDRDPGLTNNITSKHVVATNSLIGPTTLALEGPTLTATPHQDAVFNYFLSSGETSDKDELMNANETSEQVLALVPMELRKYLVVQPKNNTGNASEAVTGARNASEILKLIERYNEEQLILNEEQFGPVRNDTVIIAIQVHTRLTYLRHLVVSLAQARGIERALLVFSHDHFDDDINALVRSIDFCKVMQIFYPHSIQTHPNEFPGVDPNDCPRDMKQDAAVKKNCNNALHPDMHGHYREAKYTQTKHHWWWKANRIFNQLQCTDGFTGTVLFLEEDHYVAEDFLYMLKMMRAAADKSCAYCELLCLGSYLKVYQYHTVGNKRKKQLTVGYLRKRSSKEDSSKQPPPSQWNYQFSSLLFGRTQKVEITPWHSSIHNMGFAFNRTVWDSIMEVSKEFCAYDDYNWDYSLLHLSQNRPHRPAFQVMLPKGPRVFHIGECGIHHKKTNCNASTVISKIQKVVKTARPYFFPEHVVAQLSRAGVKNKKAAKSYGGWGDLRDQELCMNMTRVGRQQRRDTGLG